MKTINKKACILVNCNYIIVGENMTLTNSSLLIKDGDGDSSPLTLTYFFPSPLPHEARILRYGTPCYKFTQSDVNKGAMVFEHLGECGYLPA